MDNVTFRNAASSDEEFLKELFFDVRRNEFEQVGLPIEQIKLLLSMQYAAQKQSYEWNFPNAEHNIIELADHKVGRLIIVRREETIHLVDVSILQNFRGHGLGSFILQKLKSEAEKIFLSVFKTNNAALKLYRRHEFKVINENEMYFEMEWKNA